MNCPFRASPRIPGERRGTAADMQQQELERSFRIGDVVVEPHAGTVTRADGETVHLEPKVLEVLVTLNGQA